MRGLGCLVLALVVLAGAGFFADQAITAAAERQTEARVSRALDAEADVSFEGWPVTLHMLGGSIPTATVTTIDVPLERGGRLDVLEIVLDDVTVNLNDIRTSGGRRLPPARSGTFTAELGESSVAALLQLPDAVSVTLEGGVATISAGGLEVDASVKAQGGDVVVSLAGPLQELLGGAEFPIDLSDQPGGPAVRSVKVQKGVIKLRGDLENVDR